MATAPNGSALVGSPLSPSHPTLEESPQHEPCACRGLRCPQVRPKRPGSVELAGWTMTANDLFPPTDPHTHPSPPTTEAWCQPTCSGKEGPLEHQLSSPGSLRGKLGAPWSRTSVMRHPSASSTSQKCGVSGAQEGFQLLQPPTLCSEAKEKSCLCRKTEIVLGKSAARAWKQTNGWSSQQHREPSAEKLWCSGCLASSKIVLKIKNCFIMYLIEFSERMHGPLYFKTFRKTWWKLVP